MTPVAHAMPVQGSKHAAPASRARSSSNHFDSLLDSFDTKDSTAKNTAAQSRVSKADDSNSANADGATGAGNSGAANTSDAAHPFALFSANHPFAANGSSPFDPAAAHIQFTNSQQSGVIVSTEKETVDLHKAPAKSADEDSDEASVKQQQLLAMPVIVDPKPVVIPLIVKTDAASTNVPVETSEDGANSQSTETISASTSKAGHVQKASVQSYSTGSQTGTQTGTQIESRRVATTFVAHGVQSQAHAQSSVDVHSDATFDAHKLQGEGTQEVAAGLQTVDAQSLETNADAKSVQNQVNAQINEAQGVADGQQATLVDVQNLETLADANGLQIQVDAKNVVTQTNSQGAQAQINANYEAHADANAPVTQVEPPVPGTQIETQSVKAQIDAGGVEKQTGAPHAAPSVQVHNSRAKLIEKHFSEKTTGSGARAKTADIATNLPARGNRVEAFPSNSVVKSASISAQNHKDADVRAIHSSAPAPENRETAKAEASTVAAVRTGERESGQSFPGSEQPASDSGRKSGDSNHEVQMPDVGASMNQTGMVSDAPAIKSTDISSDHPVVQRVLEALPKPMQPASITINSSEFGTIRILISQQPGTTDGSGLRIQIRAADPAARALLNTNVDSLRQKLQTQSVQVMDVKTTTAGNATTPDANPGRQERRRPEYSAPPRQQKKTEDEKAFWE